MRVSTNLMVRVGANLSGLVSGFSKAGEATGNFAKKASKDISTLKGSLAQMKGTYASITEATADMDLTKSVSKQIKDATKEFDSLQKSAADLEEKISFWSDIEPAGMQYKTQSLKEALAEVDAQTDAVYANLTRLENIQSLGESVGIKDVTHSSLNKLQLEIASVEDELRQAEDAADDTSSATRKLGTSANTAGNKVKGAANWISSLRKHSKSSSMSVSDLARSLKRVGVVAAGIKLVSSVMGEFRSIVTSYISQNETLQSKVDELKNGFGQALAPAINVVTNALSQAMPYILGVSNAIGELITNLFGAGWTTVAEGAAGAADATNSATAAQKEYNRTLAGFDQINKLSSSSSGNSSTTSNTTAAAEITLPSWLSELPVAVKEAFNAGDYKGIGTALAEAINAGLEQDSNSESSVGSSIAKFLNGGIQVAAGFVGTLDWDQLKQSLCQNVVDLFTGIDWKSLGQIIVDVVLGLFSKKNLLAEHPEVTLDVKAKFTEWQDAMKDKVANFAAKFTSWKDSLSDKTVNFKAKLTSWKDSLSDKYLEFKAKIKKGWSGTLSSALGIDSITSKLNLKLPKISINWKTVTVLGKDFKYPTGFDVKWNAKGAILNGAQIFGMAGNTFLGGGEAGREALLPLDRNTGWMDKIADRVAVRVSSGGTGEQNLTIYLTLDGKVITKTVVRNINDQAKATGKNPLAAYV